ncbi:Dynein cytoplasmic 1 intermediate chain 2a [Taenia crassiceps]|uniref:Dynein cytoplasmic 1 intermediate chain 2a n=1 Tax=Taenia crassiceps TaxID=6207 RepID=A0ABR4Q632_9CEST
MPNLSRKEELEIKKARLAALREERLQRESIRKKGQLSGDVTPIPHVKDVDTDKILSDLGIKASGGKTFSLKASGVPKSKSSPALDSKTPSRKPLMLVTSGLNECSFEPFGEEMYSKETQTANEMPCETPSITTDTWPETPSVANGPASRAQMSLEWDDELLAVDGDDPLTDVEVPPISNQIEVEKPTRLQGATTPSRTQAKEMTDEDKENILLSEAFQEFLLRASGMVEGALEEDERDIFFDYSGADKEEELAKAQQMLTEDCIFFDEFWTSKRVAIALDWSPNHPEIVMAAYSAIQREEPALTPVNLYAAAATADGVCVLWNVKSKKPESAPESMFTCQAPITTAIFSEFHPSLIIAGTYVGQIVIWDTRVNRETPIQRTGLGGNSAHWEPIRSIAVTGNQDTNNLISVSADGRLCGWSLDMLARPFQTMELIYKQAKTVAPTSVAFVRDFDDSFLIGAQDGFIYGGCRSGSEPGVTVQFEGHHHAPVTAMAVPSADDPLNDANLYLTTSMDCTAKVWSRMEKHPLVSFEDRNDYLLHCDWSPSHPALFATVAMSGHLDIWNLNMNSEVPTASTVLSNDAAPNCCKFERKGSHIAVGDDSGRIRIFAINDKIASPRADEWTVLEQHIQQLTETARREEKTDSMMREFDFSDL